MSNKLKFVLIIVGGLVLIIIGVFASFLLIQRTVPAQEPVDVEEVTLKTTVVILSRDLSLGDLIAAGDVQEIEVPEEIAPRNAITAIADAEGKITRTDLIQGEILLASNLADPTNNNKDLSFILADTHVLMAFPATDLMSRESMIQRGDIIDIFATFEEELETGPTTTEEEEEPITRTFTLDSLQNLNVTAMVVDVIQEEGGGDAGLLGAGGGEGQQNVQTNIRAYLLALNPQDALILKHLKDTEAIFDIVLRAPTSSVQFELTPVTEEFIIEYYGLEILP
ncbi:Flp pilus assembly protein CpaB [bacterium]|nr:Flp pilus assembly protein CpaB [bacterium]